MRDKARNERKMRDSRILSGTLATLLEPAVQKAAKAFPRASSALIIDAYYSISQLSDLTAKLRSLVFINYIAVLFIWPTH